MNFKTLSAGIISLSLLSSPVFSVVIYDINDAVFGNNTVLRDVDNNMEFLRLDLTMGYSYNGILGELGTGGDFDGWGVASTMNMLNLGTSAGIQHGFTDPSLMRAEVMRDWFCPEGTCVNFSSTHSYLRGLVSDVRSIEDELFQDAFSIGRRLNVIPQVSDFRISGYGDLDNHAEEVFMVRRYISDSDEMSVPEPATVWLFGMGILGLLGLSQGKKS